MFTLIHANQVSHPSEVSKTIWVGRKHWTPAAYNLSKLLQPSVYRNSLSLYEAWHIRLAQSGTDNQALLHTTASSLQTRREQSKLSPEMLAKPRPSPLLGTSTPMSFPFSLTLCLNVHHTLEFVM